MSDVDILAAADERPDFYNMLAHERGMPATFRWYQLKALGETREAGGVLVMFAPVVGVWKSGKKKGRTKWDVKQSRELFFTHADVEARRAKWSADTGKCATCLGERRLVAKAMKDGNHWYRMCPDCGATGLAPTTKPEKE